MDFLTVVCLLSSDGDCDLATGSYYIMMLATFPSITAAGITIGLMQVPDIHIPINPRYRSVQQLDHTATNHTAFAHYSLHYLK